MVLVGLLAVLSLGAGCSDVECCSRIETRNPEAVLVQLHGRWVLLNYWAIWCAPCRREIPELNALAAQRPDIMVLGYNLDAPPLADLRRQMQVLGVDFPVLAVNPAAALRTSSPPAIPATFVIDPQGRLADMLLGPQTRETLLAKIEELMESSERMGSL